MKQLKYMRFCDLAISPPGTDDERDSLFSVKHGGDSIGGLWKSDNAQVKIIHTVVSPK